MICRAQLYIMLIIKKVVILYGAMLVIMRFNNNKHFLLLHIRLCYWLKDLNGKFKVSTV